MGYATVDDLHVTLRKLLAKPGYAKTYVSEAEFEAAVWRRLVKLFGQHTGAWCLTSHKEHVERSQLRVGRRSVLKNAAQM